jgi:hypothetical protein
MKQRGIKSSVRLNMSFSELVQRIIERDTNGAQEKLDKPNGKRQRQNFPGGERNRLLESPPNFVRQIGSVVPVMEPHGIYRERNGWGSQHGCPREI